MTHSDLLILMVALHDDDPAALMGEWAALLDLLVVRGVALGEGGG